MPHPNPYTRYATEARVITQEVLTDPYFTVRATFGTIPGSREAFTAAGEYVHARILCRIGETLGRSVKIFPEPVENPRLRANVERDRRIAF